MKRSRPFGAAAGIVLDRLVPEPPGDLHPVVLFGLAMDALERRIYRDARSAGVAHAACGMALGIGAGLTIGSTSLATASAVAGRGLAGAARDIGRSLEAGDLVRARQLLPDLVGRDPTDLGADEITRAVVESVAENTVDAVVAPAFWGAVAGAPGAWGYRALNTLDSMVGHRSPRYARYGWASARLDDAAGWVPARLTAALVALVRPRGAAAVWRAVVHQAPRHPSPNAGVAEAAFAGALGVCLGGVNRYGDRVERRPDLGEGGPPAVRDIEEAIRLSSDVSAALVVLLVAVGLVRRGARRRSPL